VKVRVLGTAAGGGLPQWNCACDTCASARESGAGRTQDCLAVSGDGAAWHLVNASPDIRTQIIAAPELVPGPGRRETPLRGALFTSAELDHTLGLLALREAGEMTVYATATVLGALTDGLPVRRIIDPYGGFAWRALAAGEPLALDDRLSVEAVPIGSKRPRYAAALPDAADWVSAYRFTDRQTGGVLVYAPCLAEWSDRVAAALDGAAGLLLDGSFFTDDEMARRAGGGATSRQMGHLPIEESLVHRAAHSRTRWLYTHLNNTNPVLATGSPEHRSMVAAGAEVASDGMLLDL
jgi:pyrroloquinoline quinone biosynthesis protein B